MTSLHTAATDPSLPGPPGDSAGSAPPSAARCSIATAAETGPGCAPGSAPSGTAGGPRQVGGARHDSVPQPRGREGAAGGDPTAAADDLATAVPAAAGEPAAVPAATTGESAAVVPAAAAGEPAATDDPTTSRLRSALADRLRAARAQGRSVAELAAACRRPVSEVRALLGESAESDEDEARGAHGANRADVPGDGEAPGVGGEAEYVRFHRPPALPEGDRAVPVLRAAREELRTTGSRRPSPSRRLRRMHPQAAATGQEATARETAAAEPSMTVSTAAATTSTAPATPAASTGLPGAARAAAAPGTGELAGAVGPVAAPSAVDSDMARAETPLGILIGGSPNQPEAVGRPEERAPVRVTAEPVRIGRGTSLIVLPAWRPAIAVSVPTEHLLSATGLAYERLADAQLTVLMNPCALHDRELDLHGWESGPAGRVRRGGRP
ncbi:hypothetical protein [Kitasatospora sp. NPDC087314]|uniref:hypothetical protein n=1 Tax=Kitasatospora sp. NPDC087314 TaxID=3364068 RepID=UPI00382EDEAA